MRFSFEGNIFDTEQMTVLDIPWRSVPVVILTADCQRGFYISRGRGSVSIRELNPPAADVIQQRIHSPLLHRFLLAKLELKIRGFYPEGIAK